MYHGHRMDSNQYLWIYPIRTFSAQVCQFPSALRAEIYAVLSALCTAPPQCIVKIFSDNTHVLSGINFLLANSKLSPAQLQSYFPQNHLLWVAIHYVITEQDLMLECEWVKVPLIHTIMKQTN